jgi:hypothetical protein
MTKPMPFPRTHIHDLSPSVTLQVIEGADHIVLEYTIKRETDDYKPIRPRRRKSKPLRRSVKA